MSDERFLDEPAPARSGGDIEAILEDGPADLPAELRRRIVEADSYTVKVPHLGGYEHFERVADSGDASAVFRWTARTRIAE
jgi:uncharacterized protein DUF5988